MNRQMAYLPKGEVEGVKKTMGKVVEKFRTDMIRTQGMIVVGGALLDFLFFVIYYVSGIERIDPEWYLMRRVLTPTLINCAIHFATLISVRFMNVDSCMKNRICAFGLASIAGCMCIIHSFFMPVWVAPAIVVLMSSQYHDKVLQKMLLAYGMVLIAVSFVVRMQEYPEDIVVSQQNLVVIYGVIILSYLISNAMMNYNSELDTLSREYQLRLEEYKDRLEHDSLTGVYSRPFLQNEADLILTKASEGCPVSLAVIDIDNFKHINDTYGHEQGDAVLERIGELASTEFKSNMLIARYGGEEFVIMVEGKDLQDHQAIFEQIREVFASQKYPFTDEQITISGGVVTTFSKLTFEEAFRIADHALYKSKDSGKNRMTFALT